MNESWYNNVFFNCNVKHIIVFFNIFQKAPDWSKRGLPACIIMKKLLKMM